MGSVVPAVGVSVTPESVDAMLVTTSLRIPLGTQRRLQAYAQAHGVKPTALMRQWIEQMLAEAENDRPISLHDALRVLIQLPSTGGADRPAV